MQAQEIELILSRHLADGLSIPIFLTDPEGNLLFYNESAEEILGRRFEDTGPMPISEWSVIFKPEDLEGRPIPPEQLPLVKTLTYQIPAHHRFWIRSLEKEERKFISVTSFPIVGRGNRYLGAIAIFWQETPT